MNPKIQYSLVFDPELCVDCKTCEVACKQEHSIPTGLKWIEVIKVGPKEVDGKLSLKFVSVRCMHCGKAPCIEACPQKAISRRDDGIVLIDENSCIGCKLCIEACPFKAPQFNPDKNVVEKCTLCVHLIDKGLIPSCAKHCPTKALRFGNVNKVTESFRESNSNKRTLF